MEQNQQLANVQLLKGLPFFQQLIITRLTEGQRAVAPLPATQICFDGQPYEPIRAYIEFRDLRKDGFNAVARTALIEEDDYIPKITFTQRLSPLECRIYESQNRYFKNPNALYLKVMAGLTEASKKLEAEPIVDDEGFTKVVGGVSVTSPDGIRITGFTPKKQRDPQNPFLRLSEKYKPKKEAKTAPEKIDFYRFQHRERKRKEWESLKLDLQTAEKSAARLKKRLRID